MHRGFDGGNERAIGAVILSLMLGFCPKNCCGWLRPADFRGFGVLLDEFSPPKLFAAAREIINKPMATEGGWLMLSVCYFLLTSHEYNDVDCCSRWMLLCVVQFFIIFILSLQNEITLNNAAQENSSTHGVIDRSRPNMSLVHVFFCCSSIVSLTIKTKQVLWM